MIEKFKKKCILNVYFTCIYIYFILICFANDFIMVILVTFFNDFVYFVYVILCVMSTSLCTPGLQEGLDFLKKDFYDWSVVKSFFNTHGHNRHQLEGYNKFCREILPHIVREHSSMTVVSNNNIHRHHVHFTDVQIDHPNMKEFDGYIHCLTPYEARTRSLTYCCTVFVNVKHVHEILDHTTGEVIDYNVKIKRQVPLCLLPCMVRSDFCTLSVLHKSPPGEDPYDQGGYFIVNGNEKVLIGQLRLHINIPFVFCSRRNDKHTHAAEVRSCHHTKWRSTSTLRMGILTKQHRQTIFVFVPFVLRGNGFLDIPLVLIFIIFGVKSINDMLEYISGSVGRCPPSVLVLARKILNHPMSAMNADQAIQWIATNGSREKMAAKKCFAIQHIFTNEVLPHIGMENTLPIKRQKCLFIGRMVNRLLQVHLGFKTPDDRDSFANKHVHNVGSLMAILFRQIFRNSRKILRTNLMKAINSCKHIDVVDYINYRKMSASLRYHFATGNWSMQQNVNTGVVMPMPRVCHMVAVSFQRRINTQCNKDGKATECRHLHPSDVGINCINETPEGQSCGIIENMAAFTHISMGTSTQDFLPVLIRMDNVEPVNHLPLPTGYMPIYTNGVLIGTIKENHAGAMVRKAREMRSHMALPIDMGIVLHPNGEICITTQVGRCVRPLYRIDRLHLLAQTVKSCKQRPWHLWTALVNDGIVEYLDKAEEKSVCCVAPAVHDIEKYTSSGSSHYTHLEIDPIACLGLLSCTQPFPEHNQSPRNIYQTSMGKQCISLPVMNWNHRTDRHLYVLNYPQKALVTTQMEKVMHNDKYPHGMNAIVAIMCYGGFNQEDSIIFNRSSIDRGMARITYYRTYRDEISRVGAHDNECYEKPDAQVYGIKGNANYSKLQSDGFIMVGEAVENGDVLIGKTVCISEVLDNGERNTIKYDHSVVMREKDHGYVDKIILTTKTDGNTIVKVRLRFVRSPIVGDKFASRYAQKGTIGAIINPEDMPFTIRDGIVPDIIVNPNAIPSRMTIGQLIESVLGKAGACTGQRGNGTAFRRVNVNDIADELCRQGYHGSGKERMRNGMTGELIEAPIFIGPTYYQQLKHMVKDKIHSRSDDGSNRVLTRQPMEGRSRNGGFRFGEMERDAVICHGASKFMLDRMFYNSDKYIIPVCISCGIIAIPKTNRSYGVSTRCEDWCPLCKGKSKVVRIRIPYATKLCIQELYALHIMPRLLLKTGTRLCKSSKSNTIKQKKQRKNKTNK